MKYLSLFIIILIIIFVSCSFLFGENKKEKAKIKISADSTSIPWRENNKNITLKGNVSIVHDNAKLMSSYVIFNQDTKIAQSPGKITVNAKETNFTADNGNANFKTKICQAFGNINGIIKKENIADIKNENKKKNIEKEITENITFSCDKAEYNYKTKILNAEGNIKLTEKDRTITCNSLKYISNEEIFYLNGNVKGEDKQGQTFDSDGEVIVSVKDGNEYIKAPKVKSVFYVEDDED